MLACRNIYETLRFLFFVSKIFGLAPLRFDLSSSRPDRFAILWSIFVLCLTIAFVIYVTSLDVLVQYSVIVEIVETVEEFLENLISITMILLMILNRNKIVNVMKNLSQFDNRIRNVSILPRLRTSNRKIFRFTVAAITIIFFSVALKHIIIFSFVEEKGPNSFLYNARSAIAFFVYSLVLVQFCALTLVLKQKFETLNYHLLSIDFEIKHNAHKLNSRKLKFVSQLHYHLTNTSFTLNKIFSIPVLLTTLLQLVILVTALFFLIESLFINGDAAAVGLICQNSADVAFYFMLSSTLIFVSSRTMEEARKSAIILHVIMTRSLSEEMQLSAVNFSLQLMHHCVRFTVSNLFVIDESLIHSVLATVCAYLVIVIQFELGDKKINHK
ncbi:hypothetical protein MTP99_015644 [Tenebrio molitor]|uniref:putative gustatory receptor 28b n=1 Tax=Tenebrio molitor TaxID=7067 RepID=UPI0026FD09E1|nr:hypothetical protein MTP99_015644 [Tenebrio molitor]